MATIKKMMIATPCKRVGILLRILLRLDSGKSLRALSTLSLTAALMQPAVLLIPLRVLSNGYQLRLRSRKISSLRTLSLRKHLLVATLLVNT